MASLISITEKVSRLCAIDEKPINGYTTPYIDLAVPIYSRDRPYDRRAAVTGGGANLVDTPTNWQVNWSRVTRVVYPYVDEDSDVLEDDDHEVELQTDATEKIRFHAHSPAATETVHFWFTAPHVCDATTCTIYAQDEAAFASLVASLVESGKASYLLGLKDSGVTVDLVDYGAKAAEARALAAFHFSNYKRGMGMLKEGDPVQPASVAGDIDTAPQYPYTNPMNHRTSRNR